MVKKWAIFTLVYLPALFWLAACSTTARIAENTSLDTYSLVTPPEHQLTAPSYIVEHPVISDSTTTHPADEAPGYSSRIFYSSAETGDTGGCSGTDRFDTKGLLAFYSEDRRKRLSLHAGGFSEVLVRYSLKLPSGKKKEDGYKKASCLRDSKVQGVLGSLYNELNMKRDEKNAFEELRDQFDGRGLDFLR